MSLFYWITDLLIPTLMVIMGIVYILKPPKTTNNFYGYRTNRSRKSEEAWIYAHRWGGMVWLYTGAIISAIIVVIKIIVPLSDEVLSWINLMISIVSWGLCILIIENRLKEKFS